MTELGTQRFRRGSLEGRKTQEVIGFFHIENSDLYGLFGTERDFMKSKWSYLLRYEIGNLNDGVPSLHHSDA
jgi:hypothetical protein